VRGIRTKGEEKWKMENGEWRMENGEWRIENEKWRIEWRIKEVKSKN
jgi:hypothetical protein